MRCVLCLAAAVILACCGKPTKTPSSKPTEAPSPTRANHNLALEDDAATPPSSPVPDDSRAMIVVTTDSWSAHQARLARFVRERPDTPWQRLEEWRPAVIGHAGLGWGRGLHPDSLTGPQKVEGDGRSPAGIFRVGAAYGYGEKKPARGWPYRIVDAAWGCVDDPKRPDYNTITADHATGDPQFQSAERMLRDDDQYRWVVNIDHNAGAPKPGAGSCIFFHVWNDKNSPTIGCAAVPEAQMEELIDWLDPRANPIVVMLPREVYRDQIDRWRLPALNATVAP